MKRFACFFFVSAVLFLGGCTGTLLRKSPEPVREFSATVKMSYNGRDITGNLSCLSCSDIRFALSSPAGMNGVELRLTPGGIECITNGLRDLLPLDTLPEKACARLLLEGVRDAVFSPNEMTQSTEKDYTAILNNGKYRAVFAEDGNISLLTAESFGFSAYFYEVSSF